MTDYQYVSTTNTRCELDKKKSAITARVIFSPFLRIADPPEIKQTVSRLNLESDRLEQETADGTPFLLNL